MEFSFLHHVSDIVSSEDATPAGHNMAISGDLPQRGKRRIVSWFGCPYERTPLPAIARAAAGLGIYLRGESGGLRWIESPWRIRTVMAGQFCYRYQSVFFSFCETGW